MANICHNSVTITGPKSDRKKFRKDVTGEAEVFDFSELIPLPEGIDELDMEDWNDCVRDFWGTRWCMGSEIERHPASAELRSSNNTHEEIKIYNKLADFSFDKAFYGTNEDKSTQEKIEDQREYNSSRLVYYFDTAWAPPFVWFCQVSRLYPTLRFDCVGYGVDMMCSYYYAYENGNALYIKKSEWESSGFCGNEEVEKHDEKIIEYDVREMPNIETIEENKRKWNEKLRFRHKIHK